MENVTQTSWKSGRGHGMSGVRGHRSSLRSQVLCASFSVKLGPRNLSNPGPLQAGPQSAQSIPMRSLSTYGSHPSASPSPCSALPLWWSPKPYSPQIAALENTRREGFFFFPHRKFEAHENKVRKLLQST